MANNTEKRAVVLLSGGLDSATTAAVARREGFELYCLSIDYGQRHAIEMEAARRVAYSLQAKAHVVERIDLRLFGGSALTDAIEVPKGAAASTDDSTIPITYVPARNTVFLSLALAYAETLEASDLWVGVNAVDYSGYPDCRPEFIAAFESMANLATRAGVEGTRYKIHAPLLHMSKGEIVRLASSLGVDFSLTHSCYDPTSTGAACGVCASCILRLAGFRGAGIVDPIRYVSRE